jgi:hypothetical protein
VSFHTCILIQVKTVVAKHLCHPGATQDVEPPIHRGRGLLFAHTIAGHREGHREGFAICECLRSSQTLPGSPHHAGGSWCTGSTKLPGPLHAHGIR